MLSPNETAAIVPVTIPVTGARPATWSNRLILGPSATGPEPVGQPPRAAAGEEQGRHVLFVDPIAEDPRTLFRTAPPATEIVLLDARVDGVQQIAAYLAQARHVASLSIATRAHQGAVRLGSGWLGLSTLAGYSDALARIGACLERDAEVVLYGCELQGSVRDQALLGVLARTLGVDVAVSARWPRAAHHAAPDATPAALGTGAGRSLAASPVDWRDVLGPLEVSITPATTVETGIDEEGHRYALFRKADCGAMRCVDIHARILPAGMLAPSLHSAETALAN